MRLIRSGSSGGKLGRQPLRHIRLHLRHDVRHPARVDLRDEVNQDLHIEPVEDLGGILRLHVLIHNDKAFEPRSVGFILPLGGGADAGLEVLELSGVRLHPALRLFQQVVRISISRARVSSSCRRACRCSKIARSAGEVG